MSELKRLHDFGEMRRDGAPAIIKDLDAFFDAREDDGEEVIVLAVKGSEISAYISSDMDEIRVLGLLSLLQRTCVFRD